MMTQSYRWIVLMCLLAMLFFYIGYTFLHTQQKTVLEGNQAIISELAAHAKTEIIDAHKENSQAFREHLDRLQNVVTNLEQLEQEERDQLKTNTKTLAEEIKSITDQERFQLIKEIKQVLQEKGKHPAAHEGCEMLHEVKVDYRLPPVALASFPRSGSSWTRHVIEAATGYATGAIYYDLQIQKSRLPAEGMMEGVIVIKTHELNSTLEDFRITMRRKQGLPELPIAQKVVKSKGAIVLIRNPFDAIESQFQLYRTGIHTTITEQVDPDAWKRHVTWAVSQWQKFYHYWLEVAPGPDYPVMVVKYEDMKEAPGEQMRRIAKFLDVPIDEARLQCAISATECSHQGDICRKGQVGEAIKMYSPELRQLVLSNLTKYMAKYGYDTNIPLKWDVDPQRLFVSPSATPQPAQPCTSNLEQSVFVKKIIDQAEQWSATMKEEETLEEKIDRLRKPPVIMMWNTGSWHGWGMTGYNEYAAVDMKKPPPKCIFTRDRALFRNSTFVMIEPPGHVHRYGKEWCKYPYPFPDQRYSWQKWVEFDYEGENQFPVLKEEHFMSVFDYTISWRDNSRYKISLNCPTPASRTFLDPPPKKEKGALAAYFATRCIAQKRDNYVRDLMNYMEVHSYGACLHNKDLEDENAGEWPRNWHVKIDTMGKYKFALVFENDNFTSWVTEKMPHAVLAGTVPVYMGADNIEFFEPGKHSLIKTKDFKSPKDLAEYLLMLDQNDDLYEEYYEWKKHGLSPGFQQHYDQCVFYTDIAVCDDLIEQQKEELRILLNTLERLPKYKNEVKQLRKMGVFENKEENEEEEYEEDEDEEDEYTDNYDVDEEERKLEEEVIEELRKQAEAEAKKQKSKKSSSSSSSKSKSRSSSKKSKSKKDDTN